MDTYHFIHWVDLLGLLLPVIAITVFIMDSLNQAFRGVISFIRSTDGKINTLRDQVSNLESQLQQVNARLDVFQSTPVQQAPEEVKIDVSEALNMLAESGF